MTKDGERSQQNRKLARRCFCLRSWLRASPFLTAGVLVIVSLVKLSAQPLLNPIRVLSYSAFLSSWGPGPELARKFRAKTGFDVQFQDAGDAGLLLQKLDLFPADVVLGLDQLLLADAESARKWQPLDTVLNGQDKSVLKWAKPGFAAFDWAPFGFVYRLPGSPPSSLKDLLAPRFKNAIALEDPRTSSPGLQFFFWVLDEMGIEDGFAFLEKLKPNIQSVDASWSEAYGAFSKKHAKTVFSYLTSPIYHWTQEHDFSYQAAKFSTGHIAQVEYVGIPETCANCRGAEAFVAFLLELESQKIIMEKNYMLPVLPAATAGTEFARLAKVEVREWKSLPELLKRRDELFTRWRQLGL